MRSKLACRLIGILITAIISSCAYAGGGGVTYIWNQNYSGQQLRGLLDTLENRSPNNPYLVNVFQGNVINFAGGSQQGPIRFLDDPELVNGLGVLATAENSGTSSVRAVSGRGRLFVAPGSTLVLNDTSNFNPFNGWNVQGTLLLTTGYLQNTGEGTVDIQTITANVASGMAKYGGALNLYGSVGSNVRLDVLGTCVANLYGNMQSFSASNASTFVMNGGSTLNVGFGGMNNSGRFIHYGGNIASALNNTGTYEFYGGTATTINNSNTGYSTNTLSLAQLNNTGTWFHQGGTLTVANMANGGTLNISPNTTMVVNGNIGTGTRITNNGTLRFAVTSTTATPITNNSTTEVSSGVTLNMNAAFTNSANSSLNIAGTYSGNGAMTNSGTIRLTGTYNNSGAFTNNTSFNSGGLFIQNGIFNKALVGTSNNGYTSVSGTGRIAAAFAGGTSSRLDFNQATNFLTEATITGINTINLFSSVFTLGHALSGGTVTIDSNSTFNFTTGANNSNTIFNNGTLTFSATTTNTGAITNNRQLTFNAGATLNGAGSITNNATMTASGAVTNVNSISNAATFNINAGAVFTKTGALTNTSTGLISIGTGATLTGVGILNNQGQIDMSGTYTGSGNDLHSGVWNINQGGVFNKTVGTFTNTGTFNLNGTGTITSPTFNGSTNSILNVGNIQASTYTMAGNIAGVETINLVTSGSSLTTGVRTITGVKLINIGVGTTASIGAAVTASTSGARTINNSGILNIVSGSPVSNFTNFLTINAFSNSAMNVNSSLTLDGVSILGAANNVNSALTIADATTLTTNSAINGIRNVTINGNNVNPEGTLSLQPGATLLNFAALTINGVLEVQNGASFSINPGEVITGTGDIDNYGNFSINGANVTLGGDLRNFDSGVIQIYGTPTINFNGTFLNNGLIVSTFNESNSLPQINIGSTPTLANGTLAIGYQNNYIAGGKYTFINAATPLGLGDIGGYILPQPSTYIREWSLISENGDIKVSVDRIGFGQVATDPQAKIIGNYMESLGADNPSQATLDLLNALEKITDPLELNAALISISPPNYVALQSVAMLDDIFNTIQGRLGGVRLGYASGDAEVDNGVWFRTFGSSGKQKPDGNLAGYNDRVNGIVAGIDNQITPNLLLGGAISYGKATVTDLVDVSSQTRIKNYQAMMYGTYKSQTDAYLDTILSIGTNNYQASRNVNLITYNTVAESRYSGQQFSLKLQASKNYIWKQYYQLTPMATAQYSFLRQLSYIESGAGDFNRIVEPNNINLLQLGIGARFSVPFDERNLTSIPAVHTMLLVDAKGGELQTNTQFVSGGPILSSSVQSGKLIGVIGGSLTFKMSDRLEFIANYDFLVRQKYYSNSFYLNLRYTF